MPIDIYFINSLAQAAFLIAVMIIMFAFRRLINQRSMSIGIEALMLTVLMRRVSEISAYFGVITFSRPALVILSWIVIFILLIAAVQMWHRHDVFKHISRKIKTSERYAEILQQNRDALKEGKQA